MREMTRPDPFAPGQSRSIELASQRSALVRSPYWERLDVYFARELFEAPPRWSVFTKSTIKKVQSGTGAWRHVKAFEPEFDTSLIPRVVRSSPARTVVALLGMHHQMTTPQLVAASGYGQSTVRTATHQLWRAGLLHRGRFSNYSVQYPTPSIWSLNQDAPLRTFLRALPEWEAIQVSAGVPLATGIRHPRHNLLVSELTLRLAERNHETFPALFGESLGGADLLLPGSQGMNKADLVAVRNDGLRIAVELVQASQYRELLDKMVRWGRLLSRQDWNSTGLIVVFLAANANEPALTLRRLRKAHLEALTEANLSTSTYSATFADVRRARAQIHLASWEDWFPAPWQVSTDFDRLATAFTVDGTTWSRVAAADSLALPFTPAQPQRWSLPATSVKDVLGAPSVLRNPVQGLSRGVSATVAVN